jgi:hypothetical protein
MKTIAGAYASSPRPTMSADEFTRFTGAVLASPGVDGLEIPYFGTKSPWQSLAYLAEAGGSRHVLTLIPATVAASAARPAFGLASLDEESRQAAVDAAREANRFVQDVNSATRGAIEDVELHTAPGSEPSSSAAFARSLEEVLGWDWSGVDIAIEHCDADVAGHVPDKGFLSLEQELSIARDHGVGVVINWGRSAIETRGADGAFDHIRAAADLGVLSGVVFSGCSPVDSEYGRAWADRHVPIRAWSDSDPLAAAADVSLLTVNELDRCVQRAILAPEVRFLGVKVGAPPAAVLAERVELVAANLAMLRESVDRATALAH